MFVRIRSACSSRWGRWGLLATVATMPLVSNCTSSEDTEPFVPAIEGAVQPDGDGELITEEEACERLREAALDAYERLHCEEPTFPECPGFLRPGGGSGCYEYSAGSVEACEDHYDSVSACRSLSPCLATAVKNTELSTCEIPADGAGGAAGAGGAGAGGNGGGADAGGAGGAPLSEGGAPGVAGQAATGGAAAGADNGAGAPG